MVDDARVAAAIAEMDQWLDERTDAIAELIAGRPFEDNLRLDEKLDEMPDGVEKVYAEIGVMFCRRKSLQVHGSMGIAGEDSE